MKELTRKCIAIIVILLSVLPSQAQTVPDDLQEAIPLNSKVKYGKLKNGLSYYVMENSKPENRVELRLVVNAGSILETDSQLGLAHFAEHMAFNGTKNFKKNELVNYLQSVGVKFGAHLNAYTSFDETVYILPIPSDDKEIVDQGLQILEDWAGNLSFDPEEVDKERGVVIEEWRLGQGADLRMLYKYLPVIFKNSLYAERLPIGTKEVLEGFDHENLKRFYKDWYRPNLMAVVAVGDIDAGEMEAKIRKQFSNLKNPRLARTRIAPEIPDHKETYVSIVTDREASFTNVNIVYKAEPKIMRVGADYRNGLISRLFTSMLNQRLRELQQQADPPYIVASTSAGSSGVRTKGAFTAQGYMNENQVLQGMNAILTELRRVELHGFTEGELKRQKLQLAQAYENAYNERDKTESSALAGELVNNFLEDEAVPGIEYEYRFVEKYISGINLSEVNALINTLIREENRVVIVTGPEKEGVEYPSEKELLESISKVSASNPPPYKEEEISAELVGDLPTPGKVVKEDRIEDFATDIVELSNGVKVFLKQTDFKNDEIRMSAYSPGGHSLATDENFASASNAADVISIGGIGDYSANNLKKALAGKTAIVAPYISELEEGLSGSCTPRDLETMMQLTYLYMTAPRRDEEAFQSFVNRNKSILSNIMADPQYYFSDKLQRLMSGDHPRGGRIPTVSDIENINLDQALSFYEKQFSNVQDFTFWFVGAFDKKELVPLLEKYLGGIPANGEKENWVDLGIRPPDRAIDKPIRKGTDAKSTVVLTFTGDFEYQRQEGYYFQALSEVMDIKLVETLREEKSGVYGVGSSASTTKFPYPHYSLTISFPCGPENVEQLTKAAIAVIKEIQANGVTQEDLDKIKEAQRRDLEVNVKRNGFWLAILRAHHINQWDYTSHDYYKSRIENLQSSQIQKVARKYLDLENYIRIVHYPEN